jgi:hypothetical protein
VQELIHQSLCVDYKQFPFSLNISSFLYLG